MTDKTTPLIVSYYDGDSEVQVLSNFAKTPFMLDDVLYYTVEAFWQSLKATDQIVRDKIRALENGIDAKQAGKLIRNTSQFFEYQGQLYLVSSEAHHLLLERAIRAKTAQNPSVQAAFKLSENRPLLHMFKNRYGQWRKGDSPALPALVFERILMKIRDELQNGTFIPDIELSPGIKSY